ncbi:unnamed protein product [Aspergillus oryzae RIB40]|uniref:DNA, SC111 n=1 Tax=Aspergillus oryzae (strain ATCC 42149 / RIB 40) TaxID=510516 RepID=Q2U7C9_ASPOR|nr:unnamed protein product [Aspergillus oryzae RIB40]BAE62536.1 unnamed protein product [Aspergillus oryzae RIB40]
MKGALFFVFYCQVALDLCAVFSPPAQTRTAHSMGVGPPASPARTRTPDNKVVDRAINKRHANLSGPCGGERGQTALPPDSFLAGPARTFRAYGVLYPHIVVWQSVYGEIQIDRSLQMIGNSGLLVWLGLKTPSQMDKQQSRSYGVSNSVLRLPKHW